MVELTGVLAAMLSSAMGGGAVGATRFVAGRIDPAALGALRFGIAFVLLLPIAMWRPAGSRWPARKDAPATMGLGLLFFGLFPILMNASLAYTTAARGALALATLPLLTMVVAAALGVERLTARKSVGVCIAVGGVAVALMTNLAAAPAQAWRGDLLMLSAALCMAFYSIGSRPIIHRCGPVPFTTLAMAAGALFLTLVSTARGSFGVLGDFGAPQWLALAYVGIFGGAIGFFLWAFALERTTPTLVAISMTVSPVTATCVGALLLGEPVQSHVVVGIAAVLVGIAVAVSARKQATPFPQHDFETVEIELTKTKLQLDADIAGPVAWNSATWWAVLSMAATSFALVSAEFLPAGLLTPMARDLGISEGTAGQVVTATASVGAVTAMLSNVLIGRLNRKMVLVGLSALAIASNLLAAVATEFWLLLAGRAGLGIALSGFWALSFAVVTRLVGANATGRGMAFVTLGVSLATIAAPSMGALISDWLGWRSAMAMTAGLAALAMLLQWLSLPTLPASTSNSLVDVLRLTRRRGIQLGMLAILLQMTGHFAGSVYLRPFLEQITHLTTAPIALALLGFGVAAVIGNVVGGRMADTNIRMAVTTSAALMSVAAFTLVIWGVHSGVAFGFTALWGLAFGMAPVVLPINLSRAAPDALEAAGSLMITSFQVAITVGAIVGGYVVDTYGGAGPLTLTAVLAAFTVLLVLRQPRAKPAMAPAR